MDHAVTTRVTRDDVRAIVAETITAPRGRPDRFGIEVEWFPMALPTMRRIPIADSAPIVGAAGGLTPRPGVNPSWLTRAGGSVTYEPGGQLEQSSAAHDSIPEAFSEVAGTYMAVAPALEGEGITLVPAGIDHWNRVGDIAQQLGGPRYPAMAQYFDERGTTGGMMMRHTSSLQVNLDAGTGALARERWVVANRVSPLLTAAFSTSPGSGRHSQRAGVWQLIDPTRTGIPEVLDPDIEPMKILGDLALQADVIVIIHDGDAIAGGPGFSFADWIDHGHPEAGYPTPDDVRYHLTTLFPEVRLRFGVLEMRSVDALPIRWCTVPAVLMAGLLYDDEGRSRALELTEDFDPRTAWVEAAEVGLASQHLLSLAISLFEAGIEGAARLGHARIGGLQAAGDFVDRYVTSGSSLADDLSARLAADPVRAARWLANP